MTTNEADAITVTDVKQWGFCKRVVYFERCLPSIRPTTYHMKHGQRIHKEQPRHAIRRVLPKETPEGSREFGVRYYSPKLGLSGMLDELIRTPHSIIPVDYKTTTSVAYNHKLQLACYALLIEDLEGVAVSMGYIYLVPKQKMVKIALNTELKEAVRHIIQDIFDMTTQERMPSATENPNLCGGCEFRRFCNDVE